MIGAHIRYNSTEGWRLVREVRDTRASARKRNRGLGAPIKLVDEFRGWAEAVEASSYPIARVVAGSDNYPVDAAVSSGAHAQKSAIGYVNQYLLPHIVANRLTRVEVLNEPKVYNDAQMTWLCEFLYSAAEYLYTLTLNGSPFRVEAVLGNFGAGSPDQAAPQWRMARRLVEACQKFNSRIGLHDYTYTPPITQAGGTWVVDPVLLRNDPFAFRSVALTRQFLDWGWGRAAFAITEAGFEWHANVPGSARWQETPISSEEYARGMVRYAAMLEWPVYVFTSGDASPPWHKHGVDGTGYTQAAIEAARTTPWLEETPMTTAPAKPATPRNPAAVFGFYAAARTLEVRHSPAGDIVQRLTGRTHWVDVFAVVDGYWRITEFKGARPDWWIRELALQPQ